MAQKYGILYFEEPTAPHPDLLSYVHRQTGIPVASGERIYSRWQFQKHLQQLITAASLHMECAIPNFVIHEYNVNTMMPNMLALGVYDYQPVDGKYTVPDLPGIGNEISDTAYRNSTIATIE